MKKTLYILFAAWMIAACTPDRCLMERAAELCRYIPDHTLLEKSRDYMTDDFYAVLDTMFNLPEHEALDHEWLYYFVTGNGGMIADYEVTRVERTDATHAVATILVRQVWEDGSFDPDNDLEEHFLYMERVRGKWLMSDFDGHKADCIRYIENNRKEQVLRQAVTDYLVSNIAVNYLPGDCCIPVLMMVRETDSCVWGDFWIFWYNRSGDTLVTVSGGDHPGRMDVVYDNGQPRITAFEQVEDGARFLSSAKRIFGDYYDIFHNMNSNQDVREAVRREQLSEYIRLHDMPVRYYRDYGWHAVDITD